jgi:hypothetical protein
VSPKALLERELLGWAEASQPRGGPGDGVWYDGVVSAAWRRARAEEQSVRTWVCLDGPVDPRWAESLAGAACLPALALLVPSADCIVCLTLVLGSRILR